jgi:hypothetical protein
MCKDRLDQVPKSIDTTSIPEPNQPHACFSPRLPLPHKMIQAVLIFNNKGLPRLTKFYSTTPTPHLQQLLIAEIFSLVSKRPSGSCNFLEGSKMLGGDDVRIIYRHYATLYFVFVVEESESELGILDLIQVRSRSERCAHGRCLWRVSIARSRMCVNWIWYCLQGG